MISTRNSEKLCGRRGYNAGQFVSLGAPVSLFQAKTQADVMTLKCSVKEWQRYQSRCFPKYKPTRVALIQTLSRALFEMSPNEVQCAEVYSGVFLIDFLHELNSGQGYEAGEAYQSQTTANGNAVQPAAAKRQGTNSTPKVFQIRLDISPSSFISHLWF